jgi:hypothetical protein
MAKDNLKEFYCELSKNQEWQEKLKGASDVETFTRLVAELGKEKGCSFTNKQVEVAITETLENEVTSTDMWEELPDEQLEAVAGGFYMPRFGFSAYLSQILWAGNPDGGTRDGGLSGSGGKWCATGMKTITKYCG